MNDIAECAYAKGFSLSEKLWAQISFNAMCILGIIGIARVDPIWAVPYAFLYAYGIPFVVMRHLACPRCPHLRVYGDCLQLPPGLAKRLIKSYKDRPFSPLEKFLFYAIFILLPVYPLYWLLNSPPFLAAFLVSAGAWYAGQVLYFCKRCRVGECPFNRSPLRNTNGCRTT
jgi:hypothetical protein